MSMLTRASARTGASTEPGAGRVGDPGPASTTPLRSPVAVGALAALQAVAGSLLCVLVPVVVAWVVAPRTEATWTEAARIAVDAWLLAHGTGIAVTGGHVGLVPLGLTALLLAWTWGAGRRVAALLPTTGRRRAVTRAVGAYTGVYALAAVVLSLLAATPVARPLSGQALVGAGLLALGVSLPAMVRGVRTAADPPVRVLLADALRVPQRLRRVLSAAGVVLAAWLGAGAVALCVALFAGREAVLAVHEALAPGALGGALLVAGQVLLLPVLVVWGAAWVAGPGVAVGAGTAVTVAGSDVGPLPAVPVLAALPPDALPGAWTAVLAVPVLAGVLAGVRLRVGSPERPPLGRLSDAALLAAVTGTGAGLLAWLASGPVGPGRMAEVGPHPLPVALVVSAQVLVGGLLGGIVPRRLALAVGRWTARRASALRERLGTGTGPLARLVRRLPRGRWPSRGVGAAGRQAARLRAAAARARRTAPAGATRTAATAPRAGGVLPRRGAGAAEAGTRQPVGRRLSSRIRRS